MLRAAPSAQLRAQPGASYPFEEAVERRRRRLSLERPGDLPGLERPFRAFRVAADPAAPARLALPGDRRAPLRHQPQQLGLGTGFPAPDTAPLRYGGPHPGS